MHQENIDRVVFEFLAWTDVARFCKSCDICQRSVQKARVTQVPMENLPLIDTPCVYWWI